MACQRNFDSRISYKRRHQFSLLYRIFKQISLQKLPTCLQRDYCNFKDNKEEFQRKYRQSGNCRDESFTKAFQKTKRPSKLTYRNLVATKSEKPMASQTKWHKDCDLDEKEIDWKKKHFSLQEHALKVPNLLFSSIVVCLQIPFCIRLQLKRVIFVPFARKKQTLCSTFSGNAR